MAAFQLLWAVFLTRRNTFLTRTFLLQVILCSHSMYTYSCKDYRTRRISITGFFMRADEKALVVTRWARCSTGLLTDMPAEKPSSTWRSTGTVNCALEASSFDPHSCPHGKRRCTLSIDRKNRSLHPNNGVRTPR